MSIPAFENPWHKLPPSAPYVLPEDAPLIKAFNARVAANKRYDLSLFPEPHFGSASAPVLLLALNPGWSPNDAGIHSQAWFAVQARHSLTHTLGPYPFLHLQPEFTTPGALWWQRIAGPLVSAVGFDRVAKNLSCVEFFPYHSPAFGSVRLAIPSQQFGFHLVRSALERGAEIVVMRSWRFWSAVVPELERYSRIHFVKNPRNPTLSPKNLGNGFNSVVTRLEAST